MDVALGDLLAQDLEAGRLTEPEALSLVQALWRLMVARRKAAGEIAEFNARVVVGGKGRRNPDNADRFALLAMEASRTVVETEPQLTLRMYRGMNPALEEKAFSVLGEGRVYPMLYNDDVNIPAVQRAFGVTGEDAQSYYPYGCGEYALEHRAIGSPNCSLNLLKALEAALHNGRDAQTGLRPGLETGTLESFPTFEALWQAYARQVEHFITQLGRRHVVEYEVERETAGLNLMSLLFDGTLETGRSILDRGTRFTGSIIESFGMVNVADSLTAIKKLVYDERRLTLEQLVAALDNGFEGFADIHASCLEAPKYGNDMEEADDMLARVSAHACDHAMKLAPELGFDYFLLVNINNWYNVELGKATAASADGRASGGPLANGNTPTAGMDRQGVTAMLSSLARIPAHNHAGYSHNMKFSRQAFQDGGRKVRGLIAGYFGMGGTQAMLTVVNRQDLEDALVHPERHHNLIVRVGGFSARFVELAKDVQQDVLRRTLHE
jgi:pyruvate-formate lyase